MKYEELKDKRILITGGTQGIGEAMAESFSAEKSKVFINGRKLNDKVRKMLRPRKMQSERRREMKSALMFWCAMRQV